MAGARPRAALGAAVAGRRRVAARAGDVRARRAGERQACATGSRSTPSCPEDEIVARALASARVQAHVDGATVRKTIVVAAQAREHRRRLSRVHRRDRGAQAPRARARREDHRVVAGAVVGSLALDEGDRWSDLDLTFAVADGVPVADVLEDWSRVVEDELAACSCSTCPPARASTACSSCPAVSSSTSRSRPRRSSARRARSSSCSSAKRSSARSASRRPPRSCSATASTTRCGRASRIERGRVWLAEYWISAVRDYALNLACRRRGLPAWYGRGFDELPADVLGRFEGAIVPLARPRRAAACAAVRAGRAAARGRRARERGRAEPRDASTRIGRAASRCSA